MCRTILSNLKTREKAFPPQKINQNQEKKRLECIFRQLVYRSGGYNTIQKEDFIKFVGLPGLLGEQFFEVFSSKKKPITFDQFYRGIMTLYSGSTTKISEFLFSLFDFDKDNVVSDQDIKLLCMHLPKVCKKCGKTIKLSSKFQEKVKEMIGSKESVTFNEFTKIIGRNPELGELVLQCIYNNLPSILDETCLPPKFLCELSSCEFGGTLKFGEKLFSVRVTNQNLYYKTSKNSEEVIIISDLFVQPEDKLGIVLSNQKLTYRLEATSEQERDDWIGKLRRVLNQKDIFDYYDFGKTKGSGSFAVVKVATRKSDSKKFAVKIIEKSPLDKNSEARIRQEIEILKLCNHKNLLHLEEVFETVSQIFLVTEYCAYGTLFSYIKKKTKLPEAEAKRFVTQITKGLLSLHSYGVIHRDVKLENVILVSKRGKITPKLIDFGLSCMLGNGNLSADPVGTLRYTAPEVIARINYRESVDVWGLGVILYILLTGKMPFYGDSSSETATQIMSKELDFYSPEWEGTTESARKLASKMLTKDFRGRITAQEILRDPWLDSGEINKVPESIKPLNPFI